MVRIIHMTTFFSRGHLDLGPDTPNQTLPSIRAVIDSKVVDGRVDSIDVRFVSLSGNKQGANNRLEFAGLEAWQRFVQLVADADEQLITFLQAQTSVKEDPGKYLVDPEDTVE